MSIHEKKTICLIILSLAYIGGMYIMRKMAPWNHAYPIYATLIMILWFIYWASDL